MTIKNSVLMILCCMMFAANAMLVPAAGSSNTEMDGHATESALTHIDSVIKDRKNIPTYTQGCIQLTYGSTLVALAAAAGCTLYGVHEIFNLINPKTNIICSGDKRYVTEGVKFKPTFENGQWALTGACFYTAGQGARSVISGSGKLWQRYASNSSMQQHADATLKLITGKSVNTHAIKERLDSILINNTDDAFVTQYAAKVKKGLSEVNVTVDETNNLAVV